MTTFTVTLTATFDAEDTADAFDQFTEWLTNPANVEDGADITLVAPNVEVGDFVMVGFTNITGYVASVDDGYAKLDGMPNSYSVASLRVIPEVQS
jgi:hypothetical protein